MLTILTPPKTWITCLLRSTLSDIVLTTDVVIWCPWCSLQLLAIMFYIITFTILWLHSDFLNTFFCIDLEIAFILDRMKVRWNWALCCACILATYLGLCDSSVVSLLDCQRGIDDFKSWYKNFFENFCFSCSCELCYEVSSKPLRCLWEVLAMGENWPPLDRKFEYLYLWLVLIFL